MVSMGVGLFPTEPVGVLRELTLLAESLGYQHAWFGDSQNIWRESSTTIGACAVGTERIVFGTGVTNAVTRHPSLLASTWATLAEFTGGRAALGIGTGDSSLRTMGLSPLKLAELERAITDLRTLLRGESVREPASGADYRLSYLSEPVRVPIYIAASAPKILRMAGRIADGVIILVGTAPQFIRAALDTVAAGAAEAGRSESDIHTVLWTPTAIQDDGDRARSLVRAHVSRVVIRPLPAEVDPAMQQAVDRIRSQYDYYQHMVPDAEHAALVPDELVDMFALAGTPDECAERLASITVSGIDQVSIVPFVPAGTSREPTIKTFAALMEGR
jgi:5,10-methylenetetrahydromethanopterin reductase